MAKAAREIARADGPRLFYLSAGRQGRPPHAAAVAWRRSAGRRGVAGDGGVRPVRSDVSQDDMFPDGRGAAGIRGRQRLGRTQGASRRREPRHGRRRRERRLLARGMGVLDARRQPPAQRPLGVLLQPSGMAGGAQDQRAGLLGGAGSGGAWHGRELGQQSRPQRQAHPPQAHGKRLVPQDGGDSVRVGRQAHVAQGRRREVTGLVLGKWTAGRARRQLLRNVQVRDHRPRHARLQRHGSGPGQQRRAVPKGASKRDAPLGRRLPRHRDRGDAADVHRRRLGARAVRREGGGGACDDWHGRRAATVLQDSLHR